MPDQQDPATVPVVYTNNVRLAMSFSDFRLFIGDAIPLSPAVSVAEGRLAAAQGAQVVDRVCVVLSPDLIPQLIAGLTTAIKIYESNFGPLRKPAQIQLQPQQPSESTPKTE
jgi:hypothetical protein